MKKYVTSYGIFLAMVAVTALLVKPTVKSMNMPLLDKALGG